MATLENGYNKLDWNCDDDGCFNIKKRPKIEEFAECLPGRMAFSDIDATTEINSHFLFLEFKDGTNIPKGQEIYAKNLTALSDRFTFVVVNADCETMEVRSISVCEHGTFYPFKDTDLAGLKSMIKDWADNAIMEKGDES